MKKFLVLLSLVIVSILYFDAYARVGGLRVSDDGRWLQNADGSPFFWLANTTWLLPEKLDRTQTERCIDAIADEGYNVILVQTLNGIPTYNVYGSISHPHGWDMDAADPDGTYSYWDHMDYIIDTAAGRDIYVGMVCIWGGLVKAGKMDLDQARAYGRFLAERYRDRPNIVWVIGGDIRGDVKPEVWEALATTIRREDPGHLMTFHPFGRTSSAYWWNDADWLDFNLFQSGHRRYDQIRGDGDDLAQASVAEDNWRYAVDAAARTPRKPYIDGEPIYEDIPQGLHDTTQPRWQAADCRRYAWWSVLAGSAGHTYGHNSVMQMLRPGDAPAYGATTPWYEAVYAPGAAQMRHVKDLMLSLPWHTLIPDQSIISGNGERYDRVAAARGDGFLVAYTYTNKPMLIDLSKALPPDVAFEKTVNVWWYSPVDGTREFVGEYPATKTLFQYPGPTGNGCDHVLLATIAH